MQDVDEGTATNVPSGKAVKDALDAETTARENAINDEITARENAISGVQTLISDEVTARENAIIAEATARENADTVINNKIQLIASGVKVTLSASPTVVYKNTATGVTLTGRMEKATPTQMKILDGATELAVSASSPVSATPSLNTNENSKSYQVKGVVQGVTFDSDVTVQARNKIYYGFAANAAALAVDANKYAATTSAAHTYTRTNGANGQHFYILVPNDITDVNSFTMGGAPFVMNTNTQTIGGISYSVHESGNVYNAGTEVSVVASN